MMLKLLEMEIFLYFVHIKKQKKTINCYIAKTAGETEGNKKVFCPSPPVSTMCASAPNVFATSRRRFELELLGEPTTSTAGAGRSPEMDMGAAYGPAPGVLKLET